jgi:hypothetical protein
MFELVERTSQEYNNEGELVPVVSYSLIKDEVKYNDILITNEDDEIKIFPSTIEMSKKLLKYSLFQYPSICSLFFKIQNNWNGFNLSVKIRKADYDSYSMREVTFSLSPVLRNWKRPYSFEEFSKGFVNFIATKSKHKSENMGEPLGVSYTDTVGLTYEHLFSYKTIESEIEQYLIYFDWVYERTLETVLETINVETKKKDISATFDFPEQLKINCEQYLLYFVQFLKDLGINADSKIKEEAGKVLFSVTPTDDIEALDKIREALAVYLNLPASPIVYDDSFAAMRLQQQIDNLQHSQKMAVRERQLNEKLLIAQSDMIREKNVTISQQQSVIEQQNKIIEKISSKSIMMDSVENKEEFEKVFDGLEFGTSKELKEKLGIKFNPLTSLKTIAQKLTGTDNEITSLNLNVEE